MKSLSDDEVRSLGYEPTHMGWRMIDSPLRQQLETSDLHPSVAWPTLDQAAYYGLAGEVVGGLEPHTEADPVALLMSFLTVFGNEVGPGPHVVAGDAEHPARLFCVLVGETARARKGSAQHAIEQIFTSYDEGFWDRLVSGLGSGEGLVRLVAERLKPTDMATPSNPRVLVQEGEFVRVLTVAARDGSVLSPVLRDAWDGRPLNVTTRRDPLSAPRGHHVSVLAHVTVDEITRRLDDAEIGNGFANRFLYGLVRRTKLLPAPGRLDAREIGQRVARAVMAAQRITEMSRSPAANERWAEVYRELESDESPGLVGAMLARSSAQTLRLSVIFALLDGSATIEVPHVDAALAVWRFSEASVRYIFETATGDPIADRLLRAVTKAEAHGLTRDAQHRALGRHVPASRLESARRLLVESGACLEREMPTAGRSAWVLYAGMHDRGERSEISE